MDINVLKLAVAQGGNIHAEILVEGNRVSTFIESLPHENLKKELRYLSRRSLLLVFESVSFIEEFRPSSFAKISTTVELGRHVMEYL